LEVLVDSRRYILDPLYGKIHLPGYVWEVFSAPEIQRLREVRMCNINSLCLTGGANINRFEHAIGTVHLALEWLQAHPFGVSPDEARLFALAALFHDVGSAAFGHSVQYVLEREGYEHESFFDQIRGGVTEGYTYQRTRYEGVYSGLPRRLPKLVSDQELRAISKLVEGKGRLGQLLNGTIDIDNIDNVFRLAYHYGIYRSDDTPQRLARAIDMEDGVLTIEPADLPLIEQWYDIRRELYEYLLLNPDEFSAKAMLQEAIEIARQVEASEFRWADVDHELLKKLHDAHPDSKDIVDRLVVGELYGCFGIFQTGASRGYEMREFDEHRRPLEQAIASFLREEGRGDYGQAWVRVHGIADVNKTQRRITVQPKGSGEAKTIGYPTNRLLLGVFLKNRDLTMTRIDPAEISDEMRRGVTHILGKFLGVTDVESLPLYAEGART
jgi:uncharacterized protein